MLDDNERWIPLQNLLIQQDKEIKEVDEGIFNGDGHFGSHYGLFTGKNLNWVKSHAIVDDKIAINYAKQVGHIFSKYNIQTKSLTVLDIGCGTGAISNAFYRCLNNCSVTGIDISKYAIAYAQKMYPKCTFVHEVLGENTVLPQKYNFIHAREFYPFTRTSDIETHLTYLSFFSKHLHKNGIIVLCLKDMEESFANTYYKIDKELNKMGLSAVMRNPTASNRIPWFIPLTISINLTRIISKNKGDVNFYTTEKIN